MKALVVLLIHLIAVLARLAGPGGARGLVAENLVMKQQLVMLAPGRLRAPNLTPLERVVFGLCSLLIRKQWDGLLPTHLFGVDAPEWGCE